MFKKFINNIKNKINKWLENKVKQITIDRFHKYLYALFTSPPEIAKPAFLKLKYQMINNPNKVPPYFGKLTLKYAKLYDIQQDMQKLMEQITSLNDDIKNDTIILNHCNKIVENIKKIRNIDNDVDIEYRLIKGENINVISRNTDN
jgi:hypothetical protein